MPEKHPFDVKNQHPLWTFLQPSTVGTLCGAALAASPVYYNEIILAKLPFVERLPQISLVQDRIYLAAFGFLCGYSIAKGCGRLRRKLLQSLLGYMGWVTDMKSNKTKIWALLLKLVRGPGPYGTFEFQPYLPKQPLPPLDQTLNSWLKVTHQVVNEDEYEMTKDAVEEFRRNEGPKLQKYLEAKAAKEDNWIHNYWLSGAYLGNRQSVLYSNYTITNSVPPNRTKNPIARGAVLTQIMLRFAQQLAEDKLQPVMIQDLVPLCMSGYRWLFNSVRIPGEYIDDLVRHPDKRHIIISRNGHFFKVDFHHVDGDGKVTVASYEEIYEAMLKIVKIADELPKPEAVATLTGQRRNIWAKQRIQLMERNKESLEDIESAMFLTVLDDITPKDYKELAEFCLRGNENIWHDKSFHYIVFNNCWGGFSTEHSGIDGMVMMTLAEYIMVYEEYDGNGEVVKDPRSKGRPAIPVKKLDWDLTGMEDALLTALKEVTLLRNEIEMFVVDVPYGKGFMKKNRMSPDGFIQMIIQLAYYKITKQTVKTYEPSTGRFFLLGRTETVNPVSQMSVEWVKAMDNPEISKQTKLEMLKKAISYQTAYRLDATIGNGCDRHLFALMCAARENEMDMPKIFMDKAWQLPYLLSTSQTPCKAPEYNADINYRSCIGAFTAGAQNGYGVGYAMFGDDVLTINVISWRSNEETSSQRLGKAIEEAMHQMKDIC